MRVVGGESWRRAGVEANLGGLPLVEEGLWLSGIREDVVVCVVLDEVGRLREQAPRE